MRTSRVLPVLLLLTFACTEVPTAVPEAQGDAAERVVVPDRWLVQLRPDGPAAVQSVTTELERDPAVVIHHRYSRVIRGFAATMSPRALAQLRADPRVLAIEPDYVLNLEGTRTPVLWNIDRIDERSRPLLNTYNFTRTGAGVNVYVIDSGIRPTHTQYATRVAGVYDALGGDGVDCHGHGTHVSGTAVGRTTGVATAAQLVSLRVFDCVGNTTASAILDALDFVAANAVLPAVLNMSLGGPASAVMDAAVNGVIAAGVSVVVAAGNDDQDACNVSPARVPAAITVAASTPRDERADFSNYGTCVDIFAPGVNISSASHTSNTGRTTMQGTSMASPLVAGVAALYLARYPSATPAQVADAIITASTKGVVTRLGGSPNRLLSSMVRGNGPCNRCPPVAESIDTAGGVHVYYHVGGAGYHEAWLTGPTGADFDLGLYGWTGAEWTLLASSTRSDAEEQIRYRSTGAHTNYAVAVISYSGTGAYSLRMRHP